MSTTSTTDTTVAHYNIITYGGDAHSYRNYTFPQIVALRDHDGVLSEIEVVVSWGGHEGRSAIYGSHTLDDLVENDHLYYWGGLPAAIYNADLDALASLIREATDAHTAPVDSYLEFVIDAEAVRADVAASIGEEPHPGIPITRWDADGWLLGFDYEVIVEIVPA